MKNKVFTYVLLVIVLVVWGIIFNKIFQANADETTISDSKPMKVKSDTLFTPKQYLLKLNYREPFLGTSYTVKKKAQVKPKSIKPVDPFPIEDLSYLGMIKNAKKKTSIAIVKWRGVESYVGIGEKVNNIKILSVENSYIEVQVQGVNYKVLK